MGAFGGYRRATGRGLFPSPAEPEPDPTGGFDPTGINRNAFRVYPFGSPYYPQQATEDDSDYENPYTPSSTLRRYLDLIGSAPKREEYQPSKWGRILAALGGGSTGFTQGAGKGIETAIGIRDLPYNRAMEDYESEVKRAGEGVRSEQLEGQLKSMSGYRTGQLTEKAADRERRKIEAQAKAEQATQTEFGKNLRFGAGLEFKTEKQAADEKFQNAQLEVERKYKQGLISLGEARNRIEDARKDIYSRMAGAAEVSAEASMIRAENDQDETEGVNPTVVENATQIADREVYETYPEARKYYDKKTGKLKPPGDWLFGLLPRDRTEYDAIKKERDKRLEGYVKGSRKTPTPRTTTRVPRTTPAAPPPVEKRNW